MNFLKVMLSVGFLALLVACGGGGGSAGSTGSSGSSGGTTTAVIASPTMVLSVVDGAGAIVSTNSIGGGIRRIRAVVTGADGLPAQLKLVQFNVPSAFAVLNPSSGTILTDATGVAQILIQPASFSTTGANVVAVTADVSGTVVSSSIGIQASSSNVSFGSLAATTNILSAYQSTAIEVPVVVDGIAAVTGQVEVNFSAPCGVFDPIKIATASNGRAQTTFSATGCSGGPVILSAGASGASAVATTTVQITAPTASALQFTSATPQTIYSQQAIFGIKQSAIKFRLVDENGVGLDGQTIDLELSGSAVAAGVVFADTGRTTSTQATSGGGFVTLNVRSGDLPSPVTINAALRTNNLIQASSGGLAVNSGAPVQNFFSISASSFNIEGDGYDGEISTINIRAADRLAQPVPDGTVISFIAEGGQITASCATSLDADGKSGCSTSIASQIFRPANGRVTVLAYSEGLEPFVDDNGDNKWGTGESFADLGQPFLDINENGAYDIGEQKIGNSASAGVGSQSCAAAPIGFGAIPASVPNTCSAAHGKTLLRAQAIIAFSTSFSNNPTTLSLSRTVWSFRLEDQNGNAMPSGSSIVASVTGGVKCSIDRIVPAAVPSTPNPTVHTVVLKADTSDPSALGSCAGADLTVSVKTPKGNETLFPVVTMP